MAILILTFAFFFLHLCLGASLGSCALEDDIDIFIPLKRFKIDQSPSNKEKTDHKVFRQDLIPKLDNICEELLNQIGEYLDDPVASLGFLNKRLYSLFHEKYPLKHYLKQRFDIPELALVNANELELHGVLSLSWCNNDPILLFGSLFEDITSGKKPYQAISRPLILFLMRTFKEFSDEHKSRHKLCCWHKYLLSFEFIFAKFCVKTGNFDLAFEILQDKPRVLLDLFINIENPENLFKFLILNPHLAIKFQMIFLMLETNINHHNWRAIKWISCCIIYGAPVEFYNDILNLVPNILNNLYDDLFLSTNIPESENYRIYIRMMTHFVKYSFQLSENIENLDLLMLINRIRFGRNVPVIMKLSVFEEDELVLIAKAAFISFEKDLFLEIYYKYNTFASWPFVLSYGRRYNIMERIIIMIQNGNYNISLDCLKFIFELLATNTEGFGSEIYLHFIMKFYAIKDFETGWFGMTFNFLAPVDLVAKGFPAKIQAKMHIYFSGISFIQNMFSYMEVIDPNLLIQFLNSYEKCPNFERRQIVSFEFIEQISRYPPLLNRFKNTDVKLSFILGSEKIERYLDLPNLRETVQIIDHFRFCLDYLTRLKSKIYFEKFEAIQNRSVAQCFLEWEAGLTRNVTVYDYFQWRLVFSYWINVEQQRQRIKEIKSSKIIEMLKLEFPGEIKKIFEQNT